MPAAFARCRCLSPHHGHVSSSPLIKPDVRISRIRLADNPFVIPGKIRGKAMRNLNDPWDIVCERAGLEDMRLHDCRHSYASRALALGESLPMIGRLLGHTQVETTARYAHLAEDSVKELAARVAESIAADLLPQYRAHTPPAGA